MISNSESDSRHSRATDYMHSGPRQFSLGARAPGKSGAKAIPTLETVPGPIPHMAWLLGFVYCGADGVAPAGIMRLTEQLHGPVPLQAGAPLAQKVKS